MMASKTISSQATQQSTCSKQSGRADYQEARHGYSYTGLHVQVYALYWSARMLWAASTLLIIGDMVPGYYSHVPGQWDLQPAVLDAWCT